ncbi:MAG: UDP-glucose dehydrogenase family protein [Bdellovibrionota bacterium]
MNISVIGAGYVGLVASACLASSGNDVYSVDNNKEKIDQLNDGIIPIYEPGLSELVLKNVKENRLHFTTDMKKAVENTDVIFIAVGTPQDEDGSADLTHVLDVATSIGKFMNRDKIVVDKSTVPVGTATLVKETILKYTKHNVDVVSNPEFLKEGAALDDFMKPDRVVIGTDSEKAKKVMNEIYEPFVRNNNPILFMDIASAEMTKYAANTMLATRISFMNEISALCEKVGADIEKVRLGIGTDSRIGMPFLFPGIGYGGSCFPKDVKALIKTAEKNGLEFKIAKAVESVNALQKMSIVNKMKEFYGKSDFKGMVFAVWGLAFKPKTDDTREAPALVVCSELIKLGAKLQAFDPEAMESFAWRLGDNNSIIYTANNYEALKGADALVICTEWNEFRRPNYERMKELLKDNVIFDGRNIFDPEKMEQEGFIYNSVGRKLNKRTK